MPNDAGTSPGPFFTGEYPLTVDDKGRLLIPSDVRREIDEERDGKGLMIVIGQNDKPWIYPENFYKTRVAPESSEAVVDPDLLNYTLLLYSRARRVVPDKQGRIVLPDEGTFDRNSMGRELMLVGNRNHLQLWPREEWLTYRSQLVQQSQELSRRFRDLNEQRRSSGAV